MSVEHVEDRLGPRATVGQGPVEVEDHPFHILSIARATTAGQPRSP
jgi:hypothetical protein